MAETNRGFWLFKHISNQKYAWYPPHYEEDPDLDLIWPVSVAGEGYGFGHGPFGHGSFGGGGGGGGIQEPYPDIPRFPY